MLIERLAESNKASIARLELMVIIGVGAIAQTSERVRYKITQRDVDRAKKTILNLKKDLSIWDVGEVEARLAVIR